MELFFFRKSRFTESIQSLAVFRTRTCQEDYAIFALFQVWSVCLFLTEYYIKCLIILKHGKSVFFFTYSHTQIPSCIPSLSFFSTNGDILTYFCNCFFCFIVNHGDFSHTNIWRAFSFFFFYLYLLYDMK